MTISSSGRGQRPPSLFQSKFSVTVIPLAECFLSGWSVSQYRGVFPDQSYCISGLLYADLLFFFYHKEAQIAFICDIIQPNQALECCASTEISVFQLRYIIIKSHGSSFSNLVACLLHLCQRNTEYFVI